MIATEEKTAYVPEGEFRTVNFTRTLPDIRTWTSEQPNLYKLLMTIKENGKVIRGSEEHKEQAKYNVELVYIQDQDMIENQEDAGLGLNCPNCGAPLPGLGAKKCIYCDTPIVEYNLRVWNFSRVEEV